MANNPTLVENLVMLAFDSATAVIRFLRKDQDSYKIAAVFKRLKIYAETLEYRNPSKEYPRLVKRSSDKKVYYYKLPLGLTFKKVGDNLQAFEAAFKPKKVEVLELKDETEAHFSVSII